MTPEQRRTLLNCISEYEKSLREIDEERIHLKTISSRVLDELAIPEKHFIAVAKAQYKGAMHNTRENYCAQVDLFDEVMDDPAATKNRQATVSVQAV